MRIPCFCTAGWWHYDGLLNMPRCPHCGGKMDAGRVCHGGELS